MTDELLTIKEIATRLKVSPSTVKYWRDKFPEFMPAVDAGRYPKYRPEAIEIFKIISDGISDNLQQQEIIERLGAEFPLNIEQQEDESAATSVATNQQQQNIYSIELYKEDINSRRELAQAINQLTEILKQLQQPPRRRSWLDIFKKGKH